MSAIEGVGVVLGLILILAFILETLVEAIFGMWIDYIAVPFPVLKQYKTPILKTLAWVLGVALAFGFKLDLIGYLSEIISNILEEDYIVTAQPWLLYTITGLAMGQGSSFLHQIMDKFFPAKPPGRLGDK